MQKALLYMNLIMQWRPTGQVSVTQLLNTPVQRLGLARTSGWKRSGFFYRCDETFCFKRKRAHGRLFHRCVFPDATRFIFCAMRWPHSGWRWQWNTNVLVPACAHERQNNRTAISLRLTFLASAHIMDIDFEIFDSERLKTEVEKRPAPYNWLITIWVRALSVPMQLGLINGPFAPYNLISAQWSLVPC
jgi:hypothetical protein